jgi:hypothetical protein
VERRVPAGQTRLALRAERMRCIGQEVRRGVRDAKPGRCGPSVSVPERSKSGEAAVDTRQETVYR